MNLTRRLKRLAAVLIAAAALPACTTLPAQQIQADEAPVVSGPAPRRNQTPLEPAFACLAQSMREARTGPPFGVAVGDVKDYTGKYSQNEGSTITQGGALMLYSALGKLGDAIGLHERFDTRIGELELAYADKRQLGDGKPHALEKGKPAVPWVPYFGGTILRSDYYIVGGITELNYNIASNGVELAVSGVGGRGRTFTMNIGVDLRIVDTRSLLVVRTVSLQKQIVGEEVGAGIYRFFGNSLLDINVGSKNQEPLQLGVRTTIEQGVLELIGAVTGIDPAECMAYAATGTRPAPRIAPARTLPKAPALVLPALRSAAEPEFQAHNLQSAPSAAAGAIAFEPGIDAVSPDAMTAIDVLAKDALQGRTATVHLIARDTETWPPARRAELTQLRIQRTIVALGARGVEPSRVQVTWTASATDSAITRHSAGYQLIATLAIGR